MSERYAEPPGSAWAELSRQDYDTWWAKFDDTFGFRTSVSPEGWPAIREPSPSVTFDLSVIEDGARRGSAYDAINAEALRCFVWALPDLEEMIVLDWQHPAYRFRPATQALTWRPEWSVPVYPDGDYYAFLTDDYREGTFGHPWEHSLCVMGDRLVGSLARSLETWLPIKRRNGHAV
jgi:hypothetical protein